MSSLSLSLGAEGGTRVRVRALEKEALGRERREKERDRHLQAQMSARGTIKVEKKKIRRPEQAEHKVNVEVLGEQTACLIV